VGESEFVGGTRKTDRVPRAAHAGRTHAVHSRYHPRPRGPTCHGPSGGRARVPQEESAAARIVIRWPDQLGTNPGKWARVRMPNLTPSEEEVLRRSRFDRKLLDPLVEEFKNQNDRVAAIVGVAQLEDSLGGLLERFFLPDGAKPRKRDDDTLLGRNGPLSTFSSRITAARRLGLLGPAFARSLHLIRRIRNDAAHQVGALNLNRSPYPEQIALLNRPIPSPTFWRLMVAKFGPDTPANQFRAVIVVSASILLSDLNIVSRVSIQPFLRASFEAAPKRRTPPDGSGPKRS